jgi:hypothetical protein
MEDIKFFSIVLTFISVIVGLVIQFNIRFNRLSVKISALEQRIEPFWEVVKNNVSKLFTENPSAKLLEKMDRIDSLSKDELSECKKEFEEEIEQVEPSKRMNYILTISMIEVERIKRK